MRWIFIGLSRERNRAYLEQEGWNAGGWSTATRRTLARSASRYGLFTGPEFALFDCDLLGV